MVPIQDFENDFVCATLLFERRSLKTVLLTSQLVNPLNLAFIHGEFIVQNEAHIIIFTKNTIFSQGFFSF